MHGDVVIDVVWIWMFDWANVKFLVHLWFMIFEIWSKSNWPQAIDNEICITDRKRANNTKETLQRSSRYCMNRTGRQSMACCSPHPHAIAQMWCALFDEIVSWIKFVNFVWFSGKFEWTIWMDCNGFPRALFFLTIRPEWIVLTQVHRLRNPRHALSGVWWLNLMEN